MNRFLAGLFIISATLLCTLGNFWFTYGIWPRSWSAFAVFAMTGSALAVLLSRWIKDE